jgi:hypothetical protein
MFDNLMKGLEEARQRYLLAESHNAETPSNRSTSPLLSLSPTQLLIGPTNTRRSQRAHIGKASAIATAAESDIATPATTQLTDQRVDDFAQSQLDASFASYEYHFSHNVNAA